MPYAHEPSECDVIDKAALAEFRAKRQQWLFWLRGDDQHSVWNQIYSMMWNDAVFRMINESRRLATGAGGGFAANNGALAGFIDQGYVATQTLAIRRLVEHPARTSDRQPISIRRVLKDIRDHRHLLTRECWVSYDGLPYDYKPIMQKWYKEHVAQDGSENPIIHSMDTKGRDAWTISEMLHERFDDMSGVNPSARDRRDMIAEKVFDQIGAEIASAEISEVSNFADKFVAHAADPTSRAGLSERDLSITMNKLSICQKAIVNAAQMITGQLIWESSSSVIPKPQYGFLEGLDVSWVPADTIKELHDFWNKLTEETDNWATPDLKA